MDGLFRFTLDDFFTVQDEPIGWDTAKIKIKRNFEFGGLFLEYATELEFWGDAFGYIKEQIDALGYCFTVKIKIEYQCTTGSKYEEVFTGYINVSRSTVDNQRCTVKANLELDNIYADFLNTADRKIPFSLNSTTFPNGNVVTSPWRQISYHHVEDGVNALNDMTDNRALAMNVFECLNYLTQMNTQGELEIISDFFTNTEPLTNKWKVVLSGASLVAGQTISMTFKNMFGQTITKSRAFIATEAATLANLGFDCCEVSDVPNPTGPASICNYFWHTAFANGNVDTGLTPRQLDMESWVPIEIISVDITGAGTHPTATITEVQQYQKGGKNLCVTTQVNETFNSMIWPFQSLTSTEVSFEDLFHELDALFCLGMQLEGVPGSYKLRIEPMEYFYSLASQLTLENVNNVTTSFDTERDYKTVDMNSANKSFGGIVFKSGGVINGGNMSAGSNIVTYSSATIPPVVGDYVYSRDSVEVYRVETVGPGTTFTTTQPAIFASTGGVFIIGTYQEAQVQLAALNGYQTASIGACLGSTLKLNNNFVTEIEKHGDQTRRNYNSGYSGISAGSDKDRFTFLQCDASDNTVQYPYIVNHLTGGLSFRWAFNGLLTNHHKILNNAIRIKYDSYTLIPYWALNGGTLAKYTNDAIVSPSRVHEFEHFLSFTDIVSLIQYPAQTIMVEFEDSGIFTQCWINEIEFDVNTKKTTFKLYESL